MKPIFYLLLLLLSGTGCHEKSNPEPSGKKVEFYLISGFNTKPYKKIEEQTVVVQGQPLIPYEAILRYNARNFAFTFPDSIAKKLTDSGPNTLHGRAFAVTIDRQPVYTGYFIPAYFSSICDWVVIDPILGLVGKNEFRVQLGYPSYNPADSIPDRRNLKALLDVLRADGKLVE